MSAVHDVIIVGAGPAGSALACHLGRAGATVLLLDRARFPRDKVCGDCLSPGALAPLERLGVVPDVRAAGAVPYRGLRLVAPDGFVAEARYPAGAHGLTLPRHALDLQLLEAARRTPNVRVREGCAARGPLFADPEASGVEGVVLASGEQERARLVVAADGRFSRLRQAVFGADVAARARRHCFVNTFESGLGEDDMLECGLVEGGLQYLRVYQGAGRYSVCLVVNEATRQAHAPGNEAGFWRLVLAQPRLAERVGCARLAGPMKGMPMAPYAPPRLVADGFLLLGDAVGFMDSITGEGMYRALISAELAAETVIDALASAGTAPLAGEALVPYEAALRQRFAPVLRFVDTAVALTTLPPWAARPLVRALAGWPAVGSACAAVQGALWPPGALLSPWRWPREPAGRLASP